MDLFAAEDIVALLPLYRMGICIAGKIERFTWVEVINGFIQWNTTRMKKKTKITSIGLSLTIRCDYEYLVDRCVCSDDDSLCIHARGNESMLLTTSRLEEWRD